LRIADSRLAIAAATFALFALPAAARGQASAAPDPPKNQTQAHDVTAPSLTRGYVDFGARGTSFTGADSARYERYRDLNDGLFMRALRATREKGNWVSDVGADNVGRLDQRFDGRIERPGRLTIWGRWDQIPMLMSNTARSLFVEDFSNPVGSLSIPDTIQTQVQTSVASLPGLLDANGNTIRIRSHRYTGQGNLRYLAANDLTLNFHVQRTDRQGTLPYGASFGHSSLVEYPAPIKHQLTDVDTNAEFARGQLLLRGGVSGSWFHNDFTTVTVDNPFRATDIAGTPSRAGQSLAPSNSFITVNGMASVKLPMKSRATAYVSMGSLKDAGEPLMAQTVNTANIALLKPLPRDTVQGEARTLGTTLSFTSRPTHATDFSVRYRMYDYDNRTPEFVMPQRVSYDNAPGVPTFSTLGRNPAVSPLVVESEPFGVKRQTFDADFRFRPTGRNVGTAGVGYTIIKEDRTHRLFEATKENGFRLTYDVTGNQWFSLRSKFERTQKRADVSEEAIIEGQQELFNIGEQPYIRHFDIADRNRNRLTLVGQVMPASTVAFNGSVAVGKDDYIESIFGLRDNTHRVYSAGMTTSPTDHMNLDASYSYERYVALLRSRQASPPSGAAVVTYDQFISVFNQLGNTQQILDQTRNWGNEGADRVHSFILNADFPQLADKLDLRFGYDYNRARALYTYTVGPDIPRTLPEEVPPPDTTLPTPTQLPLIRSELQRGTVDALYSLTKRVGVGVSYWYEKYAVSDFTLDIDANPNLARGSALLLGYMYRPYTANTVWGRLVVRW
jgi:MtrB/PioB family decaheme-associated outer membrane protein